MDLSLLYRDSPEDKNVALLVHTDLSDPNYRRWGESFRLHVCQVAHATIRRSCRMARGLVEQRVRSTAHVATGRGAWPGPVSQLVSSD